MTEPQSPQPLKFQKVAKKQPAETTKAVLSGALPVQIELSQNAHMPTKATAGSAGFDIKAAESKLIYAGMAKLISTGIKLAIPAGYEAQVRSRSGMSLNSSVIVLNAPGTIDSDYRGEVGVILMNVGKQDYQVEAGEKIAQLVFAKVADIEFKEAVVKSDTERGEGGFGSTGA
jgi:dUTP pyrophosphatase